MEGPTKKVKRLQDLSFLATPLFANASANDMFALAKEVAIVMASRVRQVHELVEKNMCHATGCNIVLKCSLEEHGVSSRVALANEDKSIAVEFDKDFFSCKIHGFYCTIEYGAEDEMPVLTGFPLEQVKKLIAFGIYKKANDMLNELMNKTVEELNSL